MMERMCACCDCVFIEADGYCDDVSGEWYCSGCYPPLSMSEDPDYMYELAKDRARGLY